MPSFTLWPARNNRSTIILHLLTWCDLGTSQIGLTCTYEPMTSTIGRTKRPAATSLQCVSLQPLDLQQWMADSQSQHGSRYRGQSRRRQQMSALDGMIVPYRLSPSTWMGVYKTPRPCKVDETGLCNYNCRRSRKYQWWPVNNVHMRKGVVTRNGIQGSM